MPEFLSPGVFIEEVDAGPKPIEGVSTSTAGAVGVTTFGPTSGKPVLVTSFAEFTRIFGPPVPEPTGGLFNKWAHDKEGGRWWQLGLSIKGFFDNGGQRIFVKRVFSKTSTTAHADFGKGLVSEVETDAGARDISLKLSHLIGIGAGRHVKVFDPTLVGEFVVTAYDAVARTVRLNRPLGKSVKAGSFVEVFERKGPPANLTLTIRAKARGLWGNSLQARIQPMVGGTATLLADPAGGVQPFKTSIVESGLTWVIEVDSTTGLADGASISIKGRPYTVSQLNAATRTFRVHGLPPADVVTPQEASSGTVHVQIGGNPGPAIVGAGTLTHNIVEDATGFPAGKPIVFVPTGRRFLVTEKNSNTLTIAPAILLGRDWLGQEVQAVEKVATVDGTPAAGSKSLTVNQDNTGLKKGDSIWIGKTRYVLDADPSGHTIQISPGLAASDLPGDNADVFKAVATTRVTGTAADWDLTVADASGFQSSDHVLVNGEELEITGVNGTVVSLSAHHDSGDPWPKGTVVRRLRAGAAAGATSVHLAGASQLYPGAIVEFDNGVQKDTSTVVSVKGDAVELSKPLDHSYLEGHKVRLIEALIDARNVIAGQVVQAESFTNLRLVDDKTSSYFATALRNGSSLIEIADPLGPAFPDTPAELADLANFPIAQGPGLVSLDGGDDGLDGLTVDDFVGEDGGSGKRTGIQALEDIDEISLCLVPDVWAPAVHSALILHCETLKDRFAVLDPQDGLDIEQIRDVKEGLDSKYAALYYPWLGVRNPFIGQNVQVAPSGHVAGIYARVDVERGVHKAPANEIIRGITRIADDVTKREQDLLNPKGINALRFFPGRGNRVWGARTISSDSSWKYVNVRRLFIFVEKSLDKGTQYVVFEPNSDPTWARVRQTVTNFLTTVWRGGALEGTTADQAFFVKCDRTTMSQDDIDNGRLICVIGIAPVKPAEFVVFRIQQKTLESNPR